MVLVFRPAKVLFALCRGPRTAGLAVMLVIGAVSTTRAQQDETILSNPIEQFFPRVVDSGELGNDAPEHRLVYSTVIDTPGAAWSRLYCSRIELEGSSYVRFLSLLDGEEQVMGSADASRWKRSSAYFNGGAIAVELYAAPSTHRNRFTLEQVGAQLAEASCLSGTCTATCTPDERLVSNFDWSGRYYPAGCTATVYNERGCAVTAGHCFTVAGSSILAFRVPLSDSLCAPRMSGVDDQFPIVTELDSGSSTPGNDWRAMRLGPNSIGQTHFQRYGVFMPIASLGSLPLIIGDAVDWYGYGKAAYPFVNLVQQHSFGQITSVNPSILFYTGTGTGGCSGSGLIHTFPILGDGITGIVTHCTGACASLGTRIDLPAFVSARAQICPPAGCIKPPGHMIAWWPGDNATTDIAGALDGSLAGGAGYTAGLVGPAFSLSAGGTDRVDIAHSGELSPGSDGYSVDAWVRAGVGQLAHLPGAFDAYISSFSGFLGFNVDLFGQGTPSQVIGTSFVGPASVAGLWVHLAFTVDRASNVLTLYVNGSVAGTAPIPPTFGAIVGASPMSLGSVTTFFPALSAIDEVEVFGRALTSAEVDAIYNADAGGKCRDACHAPWDAGLCSGADNVVVGITVCNHTLVPHTYFLTLNPLPGQGAGTPCHITGPTSFQWQGPNPVTVPAGSCVQTTVRLDRPVGMTAAGLVGCYEVIATNLESGELSVCRGSVQDARDVCAIKLPCCPPFLALAPGQPAQLQWELRNDTVVSGLIPYRVEAFGADMTPSAAITLDGLEPGAAIEGLLILPVGASAQVAVEAVFERHDALAVSDVVLSIDPERDGVYRGLDSYTVRSQVRPPSPCPADLNGDGQVDLADYLEFLNRYGTADPTVDYTGDGLVDFGDYLEFLNHYDAGC